LALRLDSCLPHALPIDATPALEARKRQRTEPLDPATVVQKHRRGLSKMLALFAADDVWMSGQDAFEKGGAAARKAHCEDMSGALMAFNRSQACVLVRAPHDRLEGVAEPLDIGERSSRTS